MILALIDTRVAPAFINDVISGFVNFCGKAIKKRTTQDLDYRSRHWAFSASPVMWVAWSINPDTGPSACLSLIFNSTLRARHMFTPSM